MKKETADIEKLEEEEARLRKEIENEGDWFSWQKVAFCVFGVAVVWGLGWVPLLVFMKTSDAGAFGDLFGAVNALFSGLAFAFVILALFAQRYDLRQQRKELRLSLIESQRSRMEYEKMSDAQQESARWQFIAAYLSCINSQIETMDRLQDDQQTNEIDAINWRYMKVPLILNAGELLHSMSSEANQFVPKNGEFLIDRLQVLLGRMQSLLRDKEVTNFGDCSKLFLTLEMLTEHVHGCVRNRQGDIASRENAETVADVATLYDKWNPAFYTARDRAREIVGSSSLRIHSRDYIIQLKDDQKKEMDSICSNLFRLASEMLQVASLKGGK